MRPVPPAHVRAALVAVLDIPIPPPAYVTLHLERLSGWLRSIIELGLDHADQDDVVVMAVRDAATALDDPDLEPFVGPRRPALSPVPRRRHDEPMSPSPEDTARTWSPALRTMARRVAQERRKARLWREQYERLQKDLDWAKGRLSSAATFGDIYHQETELALEYRPGREFPVGSPEPDCERVLGQNGVIFRRRSIGKPAFVQWIAQPPNGDGEPHLWRRLNDGDEPMIMRELLPLV